MATIVAVCPYCRAGGVRAPANAVGASVKCPKCGSSFTVMPSDGLPGWAKQEESKPTPAAPPAPAAETRPALPLADDVTEPSPILSREDRPKSAAAKAKKTKPAPEPTPAPAAAGEPDDSDEGTDYGLLVALVALTLVGVAVVATLFPYGRFVAAGVGVVGLLAGLAALGTEGQARLAAAGAVVLHGLVLLVVFAAPSLLNLDPWSGRPGDTGPKGPQAVAHNGGGMTPVTPEAWVDAGTASWQFRDVRVSVGTAFVGPVELPGPKDAKPGPKGPKDARRLTKEHYLQVQLRVTNAGVERQLDLADWAAGAGADAVRVTDPAGRPLKTAAFDGARQPDGGNPLAHLFPGKHSEVKLYFAAPAPKTEFVRVQLPGSALGLPDETVRFRVSPGSNLRGPTPPTPGTP